MIEHLQSILTQDNLCTDSPIYVVYQKRRVWTDPNHCDQNIVFVKTNYGDLEEMSEKEFDALEEEFNLFDQGEITEKPQYEEEDFDPLDWEKATFVEIDVFCTACFTRLGAEYYLAANGHNLCRPFIFVESLRRNQEGIDIRNELIRLAKKELNQNVDN